MKIGFYFTLLSLILTATEGCLVSSGNEIEFACEPNIGDETNIIEELSVHLVGTPRLLAEKEQNQIIDYVIDEKVPVQIAASGLGYQIIEAGGDDLIEWGDRISVHYEGFLLRNGNRFDSSVQRGKPYTFYVGNAIDGWNEAVQMVGEGGKLFVIVPSHLAYGEEGFGDLIGPNEILIFKIQILELFPEG